MLSHLKIQADMNKDFGRQEFENSVNCDNLEPKVLTAVKGKVAFRPVIF